MERKKRELVKRGEMSKNVQGFGTLFFGSFHIFRIN